MKTYCRCARAVSAAAVMHREGRRRTSTTFWVPCSFPVSWSRAESEEIRPRDQLPVAVDLDESVLRHARDRHRLQAQNCRSEPWGGVRLGLRVGVWFFVRVKVPA